jgi:predicted amidohydrolase
MTQKSGSKRRKRGVLSVATCQFAISGSPRRNAATIRRQLSRAAAAGADIVHFSECALSGYAGIDLPNWDGYDWADLRRLTEEICALARELKVWLVLGSAHPLSNGARPHNSLYIINNRGRVVERYDKCFCTDGDLCHYSPGDHLTTFSVNGVKCGALICYDVRFPELYRAYKRAGVQLMFHPFHNAHRQDTGPNIHTTIMRPTLQGHAATNYMYISANNSSAYYSSWPSVFIHPDGCIVQSLKLHAAGVMLNAVDTSTSFYDASAPYRARSMAGVLHSGELVENDPRSADRTCL